MKNKQTNIKQPNFKRESKDRKRSKFEIDRKDLDKFNKDTSEMGLMLFHRLNLFSLMYTNSICPSQWILSRSLNLSVRRVTNVNERESDESQIRL